MQNHQADSPLYVWPNVWSADLHLFMKSMVIHDTECPYWDQVSLNNTKTKPSLLALRERNTITENREEQKQRYLYKSTQILNVFVAGQIAQVDGQCYSSRLSNLAISADHQEIWPNMM